MKNETTPKLSVVIISHNQKNELKRCIESVLNQETDFLVEVIVSDDRSSDGTREMLLNDFKGKVLSTFFSSDDYDTSFVLERAALNRINGVKKATGRYLIHIDGDDFFTGTDLFQVMVDKLEAHPECNLCCQNYYMRQSYDLETINAPVCNSNHFKDESVISASDFIHDIGLIHNSCFCMRRTDLVKVDELTSDYYDDIDITMRYMGNASVAFVNRCGFVYVQYPSSSCSTMTDVEKSIIFQAELVAIPRVPYLAGALLRKKVKGVALVSLNVIKKRHLSDRVIKYCKNVDMFLFRNLSNNVTKRDRLRYCLIFILSLFLFKFMQVGSKRLYKLLYKLAVDSNISPDVVI